MAHLLPLGASSDKTRKTNPLEHCNSMFQQRVSRLVRSRLSFSRKLANHIGAIQYFIRAYNLTKRAALPGEHHRFSWAAATADDRRRDTQGQTQVGRFGISFSLNPIIIPKA